MIESEKLEKTRQDALAIKQDALAVKQEALAVAMAQIEKQHGKGSVMRFGTNNRIAIEVIPTSILSLNKILGIGGWPRGRIIEVYGPESSGKTSLALHAIADVQAQDGIAAFIDAEHALDPKYAANLGVDMDNLIISQPDTGEEALEITETLVRSGALDIVVIDSVAALVPRAEIEGEMGDSQMGLQARLMSQAMRKLNGVVSNTKTLLFFINQIRQNIGVIYGPKENTTGGKALKFYASVRIEVRRISTIKDGTTNIGNRTRLSIKKNKVAPPFREAEVDIVYGKGIDKISDMLELSASLGITEKRGAWYQFGDRRLGQGKTKTVQILESDLELQDEIKQLVIENLRNSR